MYAAAHDVLSCLFARSSFSALVERLPHQDAPSCAATNTTNSNRLAPLEQIQYPEVSYWTKTSWQSRKDHKSSTATITNTTSDTRGISPTWRFLQDESGQPIDKTTLSRISQVARGKFIEMATKGVLPGSWDKVQWSARADFEHGMEDQFFFLRLCENNWKVNEVAKHLFPGFKQNNPVLFTTIKTEPVSASTAATTNGKRKIAEVDDCANSGADIEARRPDAFIGKGKTPTKQQRRVPNRL